MNQTDPQDTWPSVESYRRSIKTEFALFLCGVLLILMAVTGYVTTDRFVSAVTERVVETLVVQARAYASLAGKHIISSERPDAAMLGSLCGKLAADNPEVYWAAVVSPQGNFIAHTDIAKVVTGQRASVDFPGSDFQTLRSGEALQIGRDTLTISIPIEEQGVRLGYLQAASSGKTIALAKRNSIIVMMVITAVMMLIGMPLTLFTVNRQLRPFKTIINTLRAVEPQNPSIEIPIHTTNEFGYLADTLRAMGRRLVESQRQLVEQQRMARDLEIAREIQTSILPKTYPEADSFAFAGAYRSAKEVGGDYFDFVHLDDGRLGFLVADVSGKSLPGMLVMLMTRDIVLKHARTIGRPSEVLALVNSELHGSIRKGMFVTMFYGVVDPKSGEVVFASAGHNPLLHVDGATGALSEHKTRGFPLGMMSDEAFRKRIEESRMQLHSGDWLVQFTDGINEGLDEQKQAFGMERLTHNIQQLVDKQPVKLVEELLDRHAKFVGAAEQYDDITVTAMKWTGVTADNQKMEGGFARHASIA